MPYLLIQLAVAALWLGLIAATTAKAGPKIGGIVGLVAAPVGVVLWAAATPIALLLVCAFEGSCI